MSLKTIGSTSGAMPTPSPMLAKSLGLRNESWMFPDELQTAFTANLNQAAILHREAVKNALLDFWERKRLQ